MAELLGDLHFQRPLWLAALLLPLLLRTLPRQRRGGWAAVLAPHLLQHLELRSEGSRPLLAPRRSWLLALVLLPLALAGPSWQRQPSLFAEPRSTLIVVLYLGESMAARDLPPSRLERAVHKLGDLLQAMPGLRVGLVAYAGSAHTVMPPTADRELLLGYAAALEPALMPRAGNDPAAALAVARRLAVSASAPAGILFMTDSLPVAAMDSELALPVDVLALLPTAAGGYGNERAPGAFAALEAGAEALGARLIAATVDDADVRRLTRRNHRLAGSSAVGQGDRWRDGGRYLLWPLLLLMMGWQRRGWSLGAP
jgi:Ca-activated chloride channel family protein